MNDLFDLSERVVLITGAAGVLAGTTARYLAAQGARVVYLDLNQEKLDEALAQCKAETPNAECMGLVANVLQRDTLEQARDIVLKQWGRIDALVNGAGGNMAGATITPDKTFFDLDFEAFRKVLDLNLNGTVLPSLVFGESMVKGGRGAIVNFSSASAPQAMTRVVGYSAAKSGVDNFTHWLATEMARISNGTVRVNAVRPGFFLGEQNRRMLVNEDGSLTPRGQLVIQKTPFGRFGEASEVPGTIHYLLSDAAKFVTGAIVDIDGGFGSFTGV